ncbi:PTS sugar transporter subunit IIA [Desulfoluna butyratoxydans]|uniref:Phosphotransferase/anion transporter n=1 Tax=Desulfoluna butyratoxydans TaxID=231438 RepID=A0A4U8YV16_9BACT|nr:PTS sugar transporter subunit IIA [Desulfoluna butyratoxydans]VFQ47269.1 phosphotransferase/anion transporter [Desulfoluna butyratoxydans]
MKILDVLQLETIIPELTSRDKKGILEELAAPIADLTGLHHPDLVRVLLEREQLGSTGIGDGIGIPHGKIAGLDRMVVGFGMSRQGVDFDSLDGRPAHIFFVLVTPEQSTGQHLKLLARLSKMLKSDLFRKKLMTATSRDEIHAIIRNEDNENG